MIKPKVSRDEQIRLIHECRTSGLSQPVVFAAWNQTWHILQLDQPDQEEGDVYIPDPGGVAEYWPEAKPDIVQINLVREDTQSMSVPQETVEPIVPAFTAQPENCIISPAPVMELELNGAKLRISNGIDSGLLLQVLQILRGAAC